VPPILASAIRNWAGTGGKVFLGELVVLHVDDPQTLEDGDPKLVAAALGDIARAHGMTHIARETGLSRESLYSTPA